MRKSLAPKADARKPGSANNDTDETSRPPITRNIVEVHDRHFGKPVAHGFVIFLQESWMVKTRTGSQEVQQLWQTKTIFQHEKHIVRIPIFNNPVKFFQFISSFFQ